MTLPERLRSATRPQHDAIEHVLAFAQTRAEHVEQLQRWLGFIEPWEAAVRRSPLADFYRGREKSAWLREDLQAFGRSPAEIEALPRATELPAITTRAGAIGSVYVIEGATLGGQMIARHLERTLGLNGGHGYRYFQSYGEDVAKNWGAFRRELLEVAAAEEEQVVRSAQETFRAMHAWFAGGAELK